MAAVKMAERCEYVDPITGKRCAKRATYFGDGQFCEGNGHDPAYPDEVEEQVEEVEVVEAVEVPAVKQLNECACGCGAMVKGEFKQGHDQRLKGQLMRAAIAGDDEAIEKLIARGWRTMEQILAAAAKATPRREGPRCVRCGQVLTDPASVAAGVGPICATHAAVENEDGEEKEA